MIAGFGKFLLVLSLCVQGVIIIQGIDAKLNFDANLNKISELPQLNCLKDHLEHSDYARFALAGLYFVSILSLITSCGCIPLFVALGVALNTAIQATPVLLKNPEDMNATILVLKNLSILGGLIYLSGAKCNASKNEKCKTD